jgi:FtsH-binding integral membrane protein
VTGHAGGSIHDITAATLAVPLAILVASQLSRSTLSWAPPPPPPARGVAGTHVGQYTALVGPSLAVFLQVIDASVLLAVLLIATLLFADASGAFNPVCPPASAH